VQRASTSSMGRRSSCAMTYKLSPTPA
jgi:hypothetical protein